MNKITYNNLCECNSAICDIFKEEFQIINKNNLLSALSVQDSYYDTDEEIMSALFRSLIIAHGFKDCNKRTAALVAIFFCTPTCSENELEKLALEITANSRIDVNYIKNKLYGDNDNMNINEDIYNDRGYANRNDYLHDLANEYGVDYDVVVEVAESIGQEEDFDELPMILDDMLSYKLNHADDIHDFEYSVRSFYDNYFDGLASDFNTDSLEDAQNEAWNKVQSGLYVVLQGDDQLIYYNPNKFDSDTLNLDDVEDTSFDESLNEDFLTEESLTDWGKVYRQVPDDVKRYMDEIAFHADITLLDDGSIEFETEDDVQDLTLEEFIDLARYNLEQWDEIDAKNESLSDFDDMGIDMDPYGGYLDESLNEDMITIVKECTEVIYEVQDEEPVIVTEVAPEICLEEINEEDEYTTFDDSDIEWLEEVGEENKSMNNDNLPCDFNCDNVNKVGTAEYEANTARQNRIAQYRKLAHLADDEEIIEEDLDDWAIRRIACYENKPSARIKAEILGQKWSDYEI